MFARLNAMYGMPKVVAQYAGQDLALVRNEWANELAVYGTDEIGLALSRCLKAHPSFPPTLGEFLGLCRAARPPCRQKLTAPRQDPPAGVFDRLRAAIRGGA